MLIPNFPNNLPVNPSQHLDRSGVLPRLAPNGEPSNNSSDLSSLSAEAANQDSTVNPAILQMLFETRLQSDLQALEQARASGNQEQAGQTLNSLGSTYSQAKEQHVPLNPELENAVKQALGLSEGGGENGNLDAINAGGDTPDGNSDGNFGNSVDGGGGNLGAVTAHP